MVGELKLAEIYGRKVRVLFPQIVNSISATMEGVSI